MNFDSDISVVEKLGKGELTTAYKAILEGDESHLVVVKKFSRSVLSSLNESQVMNEFNRAVSDITTMRHPNLVSPIGVCLTPPNLSLVLPFFPLGSLYDVLKRIRESRTAAPDQQPTLSWARRLDILQDICRSLVFLHKRRVIHRDLKSRNIMIAGALESPTALVSDFGLSRFHDHLYESIGSASSTVGSGLWMAPEVCFNSKYGPSCDVFSFGIIMWELLTGERPYHDRPTDQQNMIPVRVSESEDFRPTLPSQEQLAGYQRAYIELMRGCWRCVPSERPTFVEISYALRRLQLEHGQFEKDTNLKQQQQQRQHV